MKKLFVIIIGFLLLMPALCWGQGKVTRQKKTEPVKKEIPKQTSKQGQTNSHHNLSNSTETFNRIKVRWNGVRNKLLNEIGLYDMERK